MKKVLLSGFYGFGNTGDEAILETLAYELTNLGLEVSALSSNPEDTKKRYNIKSYNRKNPGEIIKAIKSCDVLIKGGGSLFQDVTSSMSLYYYLGIAMMAMMARKQVYLYSQGIGPISRQINRRLFTRIINRCKAISVRDEFSKEELDKLGVKVPPITLTADPVFLLKPAPAETGVKILLSSGLDIEEGRMMVGLAVRPWKGDETASSRFADMADRIIEEYNAKLVFIPFHYPHDLDFTFEIVNRMKNKPFIMDKRYMPSEIMSVMGQMHVNIGVRLHSLIFSACMGVPMIGISYDPKIEGFLNSMGLIPAAGYEDLEWNRIDQAIKAVSSNRAYILEAVTNKAHQNKERARRNLEVLMEGLEV